MEEKREWLLSDAQILGKIIKGERKRQKMTQQELADLTGVSRETIYRLENRNSDIKFSSLIKVADFLRMEFVIRARSE